MKTSAGFRSYLAWVTAFAAITVSCSSTQPDTPISCPNDEWLDHVPEHCEPLLDVASSSMCRDQGFLDSLQGDIPIEGIGIANIACSRTEISETVFAQYDACTTSCTAEPVVTGDCLGIRIVCQPDSCAECECGIWGYSHRVTFENLNDYATYILKTSPDATSLVLPLYMLGDGECLYADGWFDETGSLTECQHGELKHTQLPCE